MIFEEFATEGCRSYLVGCEEDRVAAIVDPILDRAERYAATAAARGLAIRYLIDTHTHADHFSATRHIARELGAPVVMHRASPAPFVDLAVQDGDSLTLGTLRIRNGCSQSSEMGVQIRAKQVFSFARSTQSNSPTTMG